VSGGESMEAAVRAAVLSDAALRLPEIASIRHMALQGGKSKIAAKRRKRHKKINQEKLTQRCKGKAKIAAKERRERKNMNRGRIDEKAQWFSFPLRPLWSSVNWLPA